MTTAGKSEAWAAGEDAWREKVRFIGKMEDDWQHFAAVVSDPATPASKLEKIAHSLMPASLPPSHPAALRRINRHGKSGLSGGGMCVCEAVAAHPNAPPALLVEIITTVPTAAHAFCFNPVAPLLLLEMPDFLAALGEAGQLSLLREADLPPVFLAGIKACASKVAAAAAQFHVSLAGETETDWADEVRSYWINYCANAHGKERQWHLDLAEIGLAPPWAAGEPPVPEPDVFGMRTFPLVEEWFSYQAAPDSPGALVLLRRIGPTIKDLPVLARGLRKEASADDLMAILHTPGNERGLVHAAVLRHPAASSDVVSFIANVHLSRFQRLVLEHPHVPLGVLQNALQNADPSQRRLARRHPNAPPDAIDLSRRIYVLRVKEGSWGHSLPFVSFAASLFF